MRQCERRVGVLLDQPQDAMGGLLVGIAVKSSEDLGGKRVRLGERPWGRAGRRGDPSRRVEVIVGGDAALDEKDIALDGQAAHAGVVVCNLRAMGALIGSVEERALRGGVLAFELVDVGEKRAVVIEHRRVRVGALLGESHRITVVDGLLDVAEFHECNVEVVLGE